MKKNRSVSKTLAAPAGPTPLGAAIFAFIVTVPIGVVLVFLELSVF